MALGDIPGLQIAQGADGLSDAHFAYTAAVERVYSTDYRTNAISITRAIPGGTLSEVLHRLTWRAVGGADAGGPAVVSVTFGGVLVASFNVAAGQRWDMEGDILRTAAGQTEAMSRALSTPNVVALPRTSPAVDMTVSQNLVVAIAGVGGADVVNLLVVKLAGAP